MDLTDWQTQWNKYKGDILFRILDICIIIFVLGFLRPSKFYEFAFVLATTIFIINFVKKIIKKQKINWKETGKGYIKSLIISTIIFFIWRIFQGWSVIIAVFLMAFYKMYMSKDLVKEIIDSGVALLEEKYPKKEKKT